MRWKRWSKMVHLLFLITIRMLKLDVGFEIIEGYGRATVSCRIAILDSVSVLCIMKGSLGAMIKVPPCDFMVISLSRGNSLFQCRIRLYTIGPIWSNPFLGSRIDRSFIHRAVIYYVLSIVGRHWWSFCYESFCIIDSGHMQWNWK